MNAQLQALARRAGIHFMGSPSVDFLPEGVAMDFAYAMDAQPTLVTTSNAGIPAYLTNFVDPKLIEVLVSPMKAAEIVGDEVKKGDWTTETATFQTVESTGETTTYGDYNEGGASGVNTTFPQRQSFHYQTFTRWGEKELERAGLARIDYANRLNIASALTLNKFQNKSYFFGVSGLQNYGLLNDPSLPSAISPTTKAATGTSWTNATALEVLADVQKLYKQVQTQSNGTIDLNTPMVLAMSPGSEVAMTKTTEFNVNVADILKKNFPNMTIRTAPEYSTQSGELVQLIVPELDGQRTASCSFTEKMRAHPVVVGSSNFKQKKSQGTWGTVIFRPFLIGQMLGV